MAFGVEGGLALAFVRGAAVAALLSGFGALVFRALVLPRIGADSWLRDRLSRLTQWSLGGALALLAAWLVLQSAALAETDVPGGLAVAPAVLGGTVFGRALAAQGVAAAAALAMASRWPGAALVLAGAAVALQALHGHAYAAADGLGWAVLVTMAHLLAAGAWLGGLWPLLMAVQDGPRVGAKAARWFSPLGKWCVAVMAGSAAVQGWLLVGGLPGLLGTAYGRVALVKLGLLGVLLGFAWANRYRLAPALLRPGGARAQPKLVGSVAVQTAFGLATVLAAGMLASLPPGAHEQPVWPFALRPSLVAMAEPELAAEVWQGAALLGAAVAMLATGLILVVSRRRWAIFGMTVLAASALAWSAWPHASLLLVEAYPTSYAASPTGFAATSILHGVGLYPAHCASCHGTSGQGNGRPEADLTAAHLWEHSDGELFWWLSHGIVAPDGTLAMPGFADRLTPDDLWALIDAVRARNAGRSVRGGGSWATPVGLPRFAVTCPDGVQRSTDDLRGRVLLVRLQDGLVVVEPATPGQDGPCTTPDESAWTAVAIVTGQTPDHAGGSRLLVDAEGWLRTWTPATDPTWDDPATLAHLAATVAATPLAASGSHHH